MGSFVSIEVSQKKNDGLLAFYARRRRRASNENKVTFFFLMAIFWGCSFKKTRMSRYASLSAAALMDMRRRADRERREARGSGGGSVRRGRRGREKEPAFGELSYDTDVKMTRVSLPIAQFEFTRKSQETMRRLVWTNDTDCAINALQVTGVIGSWCADMMRIMMRDMGTGAVSTCGGVTGVLQRVLEMAYEHAYRLRSHQSRGVSLNEPCSISTWVTASSCALRRTYR